LEKQGTIWKSSPIRRIIFIAVRRDNEFIGPGERNFCRFLSSSAPRGESRSQK
jgi:hypothetical protein